MCKAPLSYSLGFGSLLYPCRCSGLHFRSQGQGRRNHCGHWNNCGGVSCYLRRLGCHLSALGSSCTGLGDNWLSLLGFGRSNGAWLLFSWFRLGRSNSAGFWLGFLSRAHQSWSRGTDKRLTDWTCLDYQRVEGFLWIPQLGIGVYSNNIQGLNPCLKEKVMTHNWELRFEVGLNLLLSLVVCDLLDLFHLLVLLVELLFQLGNGFPSNGELSLYLTQV